MQNLHKINVSATQFLIKLILVINFIEININGPPKPLNKYKFILLTCKLIVKLILTLKVQPIICVLINAG